MTENGPGARAVAAAQIDDIFLIKSDCWVARDFNPSAQVSQFTYGHQSSVDLEVLVQTRTPLDGTPAFHILRYFVNADVRLLKPEVKIEAKEPAEQDLLAVLRFTLAADYRCPKELAEDKDAIGAFARNAHFHVWPYLREEVQSVCGRLRIPRITLPVLRPDQAGNIPMDPQPQPAK